MTQDDLAAAIKRSRRAVNNWEAGRADPRGSSLRALDRVLGDRPADTGTDRALRSASDGQLWAELQRRFYRALDHRGLPGDPPAPPSRGMPGELPDDLRPPDDEDDTETGDGTRPGT